MEEEYSRLLLLTEEKEAKNGLIQERLILEEGKTKELITDISHQLKNPLASLKMSYELADTCLLYTSCLEGGKCLKKESD